VAETPLGRTNAKADKPKGYEPTRILHEFRPFRSTFAIDSAAKNAQRDGTTQQRFEDVNLTEAFARFDATPSNRLSSLSAIAADGAMVLACSHAYFGHPTKGVLRYEDRLSRESSESKENRLLSQHLTLARDGDLPIRMVVISLTDTKNGGRGRAFHVRPDLVGKLAKFDGDHFIVDFTRPEEIAMPVSSRRK